MNRPVQEKSVNHLGGYQKTYLAYNFVNQPTQKKQIHSASGKATQTELYTYGYDHAGRLLSVKHKLNSGSEVILAENTYDELGRPATDRHNGQTNLTTTYSYDVLFPLQKV